MVLKVATIGDRHSIADQDSRDSLVLRAIAHVARTSIESVTPSSAELVVVYPDRRPFNSRFMSVLADSVLSRITQKQSVLDTTSRIRRFFNVRRGQQILVVSHENLERPPWRIFGDWLRSSQLPRLTFWPKDMDPNGFRLPNWWNDVDWPELPPTASPRETRFGEYLNLDVLCQPQEIDEQFSLRKRSAAILTRHLDFPRQEILNRLRLHVPVERLAGVPSGSKASAIRNFQFYVASENSIGLGYSTEKVPEARQAGCIPIGYLNPPFSDFNPDAVFVDPPLQIPDQLPPLLLTRPSLNGLFDYLSVQLDIG